MLTYQVRNFAIVWTNGVNKIFHVGDGREMTMQLTVGFTFDVGRKPIDVVTNSALTTPRPTH